MFILHTKEAQILMFFDTTGEYMKRSANLITNWAKASLS